MRSLRAVVVLGLLGCSGALGPTSADDPPAEGVELGNIPSPETRDPTESSSKTSPPPEKRGYAAGSILPSIAREVLDREVLDLWMAWKARYLIEGCGAIYGDASSDGPLWSNRAPDTITVSELQAYAMLLTVQMADRDPDAHRLFDGLFAFARAFPTRKSSHLMSWNQVKGCLDSPRGSDAATDADLDIAYALLLASARWGDSGPIDYGAAAREVIGAIRTHEMDPVTHLALLGDFVVAGEGKLGQTVRMSDVVPDHFRAFGRATGEPFWERAVDAHWQLVSEFQDRYTPGTGLFPDFLIDVRSDPKPAPGKWLEHPTDGAFSWNACRVPWRLGTDWLISGDPRARAALQRLNAFIRAKTGDDPRRIDGGYHLDGDAIPPHLQNETAFVAAFGVAAMTDEANQAWLDAIWTRVAESPLGADNYYGNSLKLLSMIVMSGRWLAP